MSVTERLSGAAGRLAELEVPVPDAGRVLRRSRRRRGSVYGVAVAALVLGGIGVVATSGTDPATVATRGGAVTSASSVSCCNLDDLPKQFWSRRAVLAPPRADDRVGLSRTDVLGTLGRYTDLDYVALQPGGGSIPVLSDRLVWVLIESNPSHPPGAEVGVHIIDAHTGQELLSFGAAGPGGGTCLIEPGAAPDRCGFREAEPHQRLDTPLVPFP